VHLAIAQTEAPVANPATAPLAAKAGRPSEKLGTGIFRQWIARQWTDVASAAGTVNSGAPAGVRAGEKNRGEKNRGAENRGAEEIDGAGQCGHVQTGAGAAAVRSVPQNSIETRQPRVGAAKPGASDDAQHDAFTAAGGPNASADIVSPAAWAKPSEPQVGATGAETETAAIAQPRTGGPAASAIAGSFQQTVKVEGQSEMAEAPGRSTAVRKSSETASKKVLGKTQGPRIEKDVCGARAENAGPAQKTLPAHFGIPVPPLLSTAAGIVPSHAAASSGSPAPASLAARPSRTVLSGTLAPGLQPASGPTGVVRVERSNSAAAQERASAPAAETATKVPVQHPVSGGSVAPVAGLADKAEGSQQHFPAVLSMAVSASPSRAAAHALPAQSGAVFDHIDSGPAPQVLSRTPQRLDVGVRDSGLGWVEIHAHAAEGQIAATVSASPAAHPALSAQLPAMRDYLAGQQVRVDSLEAQPFQASADAGHSSAGQQQASRNSSGAAAAGADPPGVSAEAEPESLSWIDVRV
jgi:hypothetical protein